MPPFCPRYRRSSVTSRKMLVSARGLVPSEVLEKVWVNTGGLLSSVLMVICSTLTE